MPKLIIMMGPPGSGKGTQAQILQKKLNCHYIATGDLVREMREKAYIGDPIAVEVKKRYDRGEPQPDELILKAVRQKLSLIDLDAGIIFDAFPLSEKQAWGLEELINEFHLPQPVAVSIEVSEDEVVKRLTLRKFCPKDNSVYYPKSPTYDENVCSICGEQLVKRADDIPEVVRERYKEYIERINAIENFYDKKGQLIKIFGEQSVEQVAEEVAKKLQSYTPKESAE